jgi:hypothetical protein
MMKALVFYWDPQHWPLARQALIQAGRRDLIGRGSQALVPPEHGAPVMNQGRGSARDRRPPAGRARRR